MNKRLFIHDPENPGTSLKAQVRDGEIILLKGAVEVSLKAYEESQAGAHLDILNLGDDEKAWITRMKPIIGGEISRQAGHSFDVGDVILVPVVVKRMTKSEQMAAGNLDVQDEDIVVFTKLPIYEQFTVNGQGRPVFKAVPASRHRYGTEFSVAAPCTMRTRAHDEIQTKGVVCICVSEIPEDTIMFRVMETRSSTLLVRAVRGDATENLFPFYTYRAPRLSRAESVDEIKV